MSGHIEEINNLGMWHTFVVTFEMPEHLRKKAPPRGIFYREVVVSKEDYSEIFRGIARAFNEFAVALDGTTEATFVCPNCKSYWYSERPGYCQVCGERYCDEPIR